MRKYEGMFILKPDMNPEEMAKTVSLIEETIRKNGGVVERCERWAKRRLAYIIKKYTEGEYYRCEFEAEPGSISVVQGACRLNDNILRSLITAKE